MTSLKFRYSEKVTKIKPFFKNKGGIKNAYFYIRSSTTNKDVFKTCTIFLFSKTGIAFLPFFTKQKFYVNFQYKIVPNLRTAPLFFISTFDRKEKPSNYKPSKFISFSTFVMICNTAIFCLSCTHWHYNYRTKVRYFKLR